MSTTDVPQDRKHIRYEIQEWYEGVKEQFGSAGIQPFWKVIVHDAPHRQVIGLFNEFRAGGRVVRLLRIETLVDRVGDANAVIYNPLEEIEIREVARRLAAAVKQPE